MSGALTSSQWFRVAALAPCLRGHLHIHRHVYRGQVWYAVEDRASGRQHRFNPAAYRVLRMFDGKCTLQAIWDQLLADLRDDSPTQDEIVNLLGQLNASDLVRFDATPDVAELFERREKYDRRRWMSRLLNPMSLRFPLWDPDVFLRHLARCYRPLPTSLVVCLWFAVVIPALILIPPHWSELTRNFGERLMAADNLWVLALTFPLLKAVHELAHGLVVRLRGGEVHEMGLMLLVFYPVPYVDASAASAFVRKWYRVLVGAAGMLAEVWVAAIAFYLWLLIEPGIARSVAYNLIVVGSVSTILFNANPLLRFDGYYMLADLLEIPNLGQRSNSYWQYLISRYVFGVTSAVPPQSTAAERRWFIVYAPLATVYRVLISLGIAWFVAQHYFFVGILLAIWSLIAMVLFPLFKGFKALVTQQQFTSRAARVWGTLGAAACALVVMLFVVAMPYHTPAQGVVWLPEHALLRAGADGFVSRLLVEPGNRVDESTKVLETFEPSLDARVREQVARVEEANAQLDAAWSTPAQAGRIQEELRREQAVLARLSDELAHLSLRAHTSGQLVIDRAADLPGRFVRKGEVLGHVIGNDTPLVKVIVAQSDVEWVRSATRRVELRFPQNIGEVLVGNLVRAVPQASNDLPSAALGQSGGGDIVIDPREEGGTKSLDTVFEFEVEVPSLRGSSQVFLGSRAYVTFEHAPEPIGWRWVRRLRTQFLSQFEV